MLSLIPFDRTELLSPRRSPVYTSGVECSANALADRVGTSATRLLEGKAAAHRVRS